METLLFFVLALAVQTVISGGLLWCGLALTGESGDIRALFIAALVASLLQLIPFAGGLISFLVLLVLLSKWTSVDIWPGGVLVVVVANFLGAFLSMMLMASFA